MSDTKPEIIQRLLETNTEFQSLHETHHHLKDQIHDAQESHTLDEQTLGTLKREKLRTKDRMEELIRAVR